MQEDISDLKIREKLGFLKTTLPRQPTAVQGFYHLPKPFEREVLDTKFSQSSLQKISDHLGYFLGLLNSVKITIGVESSNYMLSAASDVKKADEVGLYKVLDQYHQAIQLTKKFRFKLEHVLAILAHESTHNYLYNHGVRESQELENEILTDLAAAYLGLGHLLVPGYKPITWTTNHWNYILARSYSTHTLSIGYVTPGTIIRATIMSAEFRKWNPKEVIANCSSVWDKIIAYFQLWPYRNRFKKIQREKKETAIHTKQREEQFNSLKMEIHEIRGTYNRVCEQIQNVSTTMDPSSITAEDGHMLVEITNKISIGEPASEIRRISEKISGLGISQVNKKDLSKLVKQVDDLKNIISKWYRLLCKYSSDDITQANSDT